jgi:hypothetical protein
MCGSKALSLSQLRNRDGEFFADGEEDEIIKYRRTAQAIQTYDGRSSNQSNDLANCLRQIK